MCDLPPALQLCLAFPLTGLLPPALWISIRRLEWCVAFMSAEGDIGAVPVPGIRFHERFPM
eukprot:SAG11_NODE_2765_length_2998_cov_7.305278_3_plen_61_part_00